MTTHEAAKLIADALNVTPDVAAKTWFKGSRARVYVRVDGLEVGFIDVGARRPFDGITKHSGLISCAAERAVKLTGSRAEELQVVKLPEAPRLPAEPRDAYTDEPSPETGHVGWCWWAMGEMGDAPTYEAARDAAVAEIQRRMAVL